MKSAVLAESSHAHRRLAEARTIVAGNLVATAIVERADALLRHDEKRLRAPADTFDAAGCPYQSARILKRRRRRESPRRSRPLTGRLQPTSTSYMPAR